MLHLYLRCLCFMTSSAPSALKLGQTRWAVNLNCETSNEEGCSTWSLVADVGCSLPAVSKFKAHMKMGDNKGSQ